MLGFSVFRILRIPWKFKVNYQCNSSRVQYAILSL